MTENTKVTAAATPSVGGMSVVFFPPRPDLNGSLLKAPGDPSIYLVDQGFRRHIVDVNTLRGVFTDDPSILETSLILDVPPGDPILPGTALARGDGTAPVYLVEPGPVRGVLGTKRWIASPQIMNRYQFDGGKVHPVPPVLLLDIADGLAISA